MAEVASVPRTRRERPDRRHLVALGGVSAILIVRDPQDSRLRWTFAGQPRVAVAGEDGTLRFLLTRHVEEGLRVSGKSSLFTATLDEIRAEIARQEATTPGTP